MGFEGILVRQQTIEAAILSISVEDCPLIGAQN